MNTLASVPPPREMTRALLERDAAYDGIFFAAVRSTSIFCRPSCGARKPRPENVEFFATAREALREGYRPCLRCLPLSIGSVPGWARGLLDAVERNPGRRLRDADLRRLGIEPARARRWFLKRYGLTFQAFSRGRRLSGTLAALREGKPIDGAVEDGGYASHSGFRAAFAKSFRTTPARAAAVDAVTLAWMETPLGPMAAGATDEGLCLLEFTGRRALERELAEVFHRPVVAGETPILRRLRAELAAYFRGSLKRFTVPVAFAGSAFERRVWSELLKIPYGETRSYADLAVAAGRPAACRAVGSANGRNRIAVVVPCHRVVRKDGSIGGYGGGVWRKRRLLEIEGVRLEGQAPRRQARFSTFLAGAGRVVCHDARRRAVSSPGLPPGSAGDGPARPREGSGGGGPRRGAEGRGLRDARPGRHRGLR